MSTKPSAFDKLDSKKSLLTSHLGRPNQNTKALALIVHERSIENVTTGKVTRSSSLLLSPLPVTLVHISVHVSAQVQVLVSLFVAMFVLPLLLLDLFVTTFFPQGLRCVNFLKLLSTVVPTGSLRTWAGLAAFSTSCIVYWIVVSAELRRTLPGHIHGAGPCRMSQYTSHCWQRTLFLYHVWHPGTSRHRTVVCTLSIQAELGNSTGRALHSDHSR